VIVITVTSGNLPVPIIVMSNNGDTTLRIDLLMLVRDRVDGIGTTGYVIRSSGRLVWMR
jgi:hypothetical protein